AVVIAMPLSYPAVFLLPGIVAAVYIENRKAALILASAAGAVLLVLYFAFIRPNMSGELQTYWSWEAETGFTKGTVLALAMVIVLAWTSRLPPSIQLMTVLPCVLLALSSALGWYPLSYRTRLFVLPCFLLALVMSLERLCK